MFTDLAVNTLEKLVGWGKPVPPTTIVLTTVNEQKDSGLTVEGFHKLARTRTMFFCVPNENVSNDDFNDYLKDLRRQAVIKVLNSVFEHNTSESFLRSPSGKLINRYEQDFNPMVQARKAAFTKAIGYQMAVDCLEAMIATNRINAEERAASLAYENLKIELEGLSETNSRGIKGSLYGALKALSSTLFPEYPKKPTARFINLD